MIKKITILLFFAIAILPATFNKAQAQNYATEGMPQEDGSIDYYHRVDFTYGPSEWVYDYTVVPSDVDWCDCSGEPNPDDPTNDPDWGYPDWAEMEDYLNYLDDMIGDPYSFNNTWGGTYDDNAIQYFITVNEESQRHYDGSRLNFSKRNGGSFKFTLGLEGTGVLQEAGLRWKVNGVVKTSFNNNKVMWMPSDTKGIYNVEVWEENIRKLIIFTVSIFDKSVVNFHRKNIYNGQYGFDEVGHVYDSLKKDYMIRQIDSLPYHVPWMSILHNTFDTIAVEPVIDQVNLSNSNYWIDFISEDPSIKINGLNTIRKYGTELSTFKSLKISAVEIDPVSTSRTRKAVYAVDNSGDTVGMFQISCQKPLLTKFVIVYVNTGQGYRDTVSTIRKMTKDSLVNFLNMSSHNQIFKEWQLQTTFPDRLDISSEFTANPNAPMFTIDDSTVRRLDAYYKIKTGTDVLDYSYFNGSDSRTIRFIYITDIDLGGGIVRYVGSNSGCVYLRSNYITAAHELGHELNLMHTFLTSVSDAYGPNIPIRRTTNFMDYTPLDRRNMFFYYQWPHSY